MVKVGQLEIVIDAAVYVVAKRRDGICNLKDADASPKLVLFVDSEALSLLINDALILQYSKSLTICVNKDAIAILESFLNCIKVHEGAFKKLHLRVV